MERGKLILIVVSEGQVPTREELGTIRDRWLSQRFLPVIVILLDREEEETRGDDHVKESLIPHWRNLLDVGEVKIIMGNNNTQPTAIWEARGGDSNVRMESFGCGVLNDRVPWFVRSGCGEIR